MITEKNVANLLIVKDGSDALTAGHNVSADLAGMFTGEAVITTPGGIIVDGSATENYPEFKIGVKNSDGKLQWTDIIKAKSIKNITAKRYAAATLQTDYVGYNGTSGSIDAISNNFYTIRLYLVPLDMMGFAQQKIIRAAFKSDSAATQSEIAYGVANELIKNMSKMPEKTKFGIDNIKIERINSGAQLSSIGSLTCAVTKGSQYITFSGAANSYVSVGSILRFGTTGAGTAPCYIVTEAVSTTVFKLDIPWQGTTASAFAAASLETVTEGNWGISITGVKYTFDAPKFNYLLPRWKTTLQDFGATTVTEATASTEGTGTYEEVSQMEQQFQGNEGMWYRAQVPYPTFRSEAASGTTYAIVCIEFEDSMGTTLGSVANSYKQVYLACVKGSSDGYTDSNTGLGATLDDYITQYSIPSNRADMASNTIAGEIAA